ncbi:hypothetical protein AZF37_02145 [endosymbiont 'TC1' of Trimyema compressum]|uniref:sensor histidine kinase n=1 Tax=endosymbiont 'TC1' of Trimyema compressum TaxID=243899 RepID=UPI0007F0BC18|nr:ATP-binding protein [endosymbiont 'TC1' of Trimyema compressum]AMP20135.1 hypothetical protein AZF37_02145 [endosymbiont 'TC1' of Trimyema compressum]
MNLLVEDLLHLAQSEDENIIFQKTLVNITEALEGLLISLEAIAYEKQIVFENRIEKNLTTIGDSVIIKQILMILLDNGIKYAPKGNRMKIALIDTGKYLKFTIINSSVPSQMIDENKIFNSFCRADSSREHSQGGYGLGLAIAKSFIEKLGGVFPLMKVMEKLYLQYFF